MSPQDTLKAAGVNCDIIRNAKPGISLQGDELWTTVTRYIDTRGIIALGWLSTSNWTVSVDVRRGGNGLLISMVEGTA